MRVYLDNCIFNRPFDDQSSDRIRSETEAIRIIFDKVSDGSIDIVWSSVLAFEIEQNPHRDRLEWIAAWEVYAIVDVEETESVLAEAKILLEFGLKKLDAIHIASGGLGLADYFVTTDDRILKKASLISSIKICGPQDFINRIGE